MCRRKPQSPRRELGREWHSREACVASSDPHDCALCRLRTIGRGCREHPRHAGSSQRGGRPRRDQGTWPFILLAVLESLSLNSNGHLVVEWLIPALACAAVIQFGRSDRVVKAARWLLVISAILLWIHGGWLLTHGYVTRPSALATNRKVESAWYSPLTGLRPTIQTGATTLPAKFGTP